MICARSASSASLPAKAFAQRREFAGRGVERRQAFVGGALQVLHPGLRLVEVLARAMRLAGRDRVALEVGRESLDHDQTLLGGLLHLAEGGFPRGQDVPDLEQFVARSQRPLEFRLQPFDHRQPLFGGPLQIFGDGLPPVGLAREAAQRGVGDLEEAAALLGDRAEVGKFGFQRSS
jgi:hypothetical protein